MDTRRGPGGMSGAGLAPTPSRCPLCGRPVAADGLGLVECSCGWGGAGDPLEAARGLARARMRLDRRAANALARRDLARVRRRPDNPGALSAAYVAVLVVVSALVYLVAYGLLAGGAALVVSGVRDRVWVLAGLGALLAVVALFLLVYRRPREPGVEASRDRFPRLFTALEEVSGRLKAPLPGRVVLVPGVTAYVYQHRPPRRLFRRELVLGLGVGSLPLLSDLDLKAILAHELAHFGQSHTRLHGYFAGAERVLYRTLDLLQGARQSGSRRYFYGYGSRTNMTADLVASVVSLPVRALWMGFHLVRMAESRAAEFAADRAAARAYGTQAFVDGLTGLRVADRTLRGAGPALAAAMRERGEANFYAALRRHYAALPPAVIVKLRQEAVQGFRTLDQTHPVTPDRVRALYLAPVPPLIPPTCPASDLVVPEGVAGADALERELTALLLD